MGSPYLLDEVIPDYDVVSLHVSEVEAPPDAVTRAVESFRLDRDASVASRLLFRLRGLPAPGGTIREALVGLGFRVLAEHPGEEIVVGTMGRFWALAERASIGAPADLEAFQAFDRPASAVGAMSLRWERLPGGRTLLSTETRVRGTDEAGRRRFRCYWALIRPFSGAIRRDLLRGIAARAEALETVPAASPGP
jgi:hypothetical protein